MKQGKRIPKCLYGWKLYVNYGQGWEYEVFEQTWAGKRATAKDYSENQPQYPTKWTYGRETNPAHPCWSQHEVQSQGLA